MQINDRIAVRYLDKGGQHVGIAAIGTVTEVANIEDGELKVIWDYNPPKYSGSLPSGQGAGNWWKTIIELKRPDVVQSVFQEAQTGRRIARLAWNDNGWVMPSGTKGKSLDEDSHEFIYGYGHEEWLFDTSKLIEGYHYAFLEPIKKEQDAFRDNSYDIWLYTIDGISKVRYWIGEISDVEVLNSEKALDVYSEYERRGWIKQMKQQIDACDVDGNTFYQWKGIDLFNIRFKPASVVFNDSYVPLPEGNPIIHISRYTFAHFKEKYTVQSSLDVFDNFHFPDFDNDSDEETEKVPEKRTYDRAPKAIEITLLHKAISDNLRAHLKGIYGSNKVKTECNAGYGSNRIDIVVSDHDGFIFYEIKTYQSIRSSVREALGQLLEYCFWPDKCKAKELVIVTQRPPNEKIKRYFAHLRATLHIPIFYQSFDIDSNTLSNKF